MLHGLYIKDPAEKTLHFSGIGGEFSPVRGTRQETAETTFSPLKGRPDLFGLFLLLSLSFPLFFLFLPLFDSVLVI